MAARPDRLAEFLFERRLWHPQAPFGIDFPLEVENTVTFTERDGPTTVALQSLPHGATVAQRTVFDGMFESMQGGFGGTFDHLGEYLAGCCAIAIGDRFARFPHRDSRAFAAAASAPLLSGNIATYLNIGIVTATTLSMAAGLL